MNSLRVIAPYIWEGMWVFDDARVGLDREPFVSGADDIIDLLVADIPKAEGGFRLIFSDVPFPSHQVTVEWRREESGGNWYYSPAHDKEGWLCPALMKYFPHAPMRIYIRAEPKA
jgi:uncharacterized protein DUF6717